MGLRAFVFFMLTALAYVGLIALISAGGSLYYRQFAIGLCVAALLWLLIKYGGFAGVFFTEKDK